MTRVFDELVIFSQCWPLYLDYPQMADIPPENSGKKPLNDYIKYAGLGFEILACILLFAGLGYGLDQWTETEKPWFLLGLSLVGCGVAMYLMIRVLGQK